MKDQAATPPAKRQAGRPEKPAARQARLAEALRANLRRRKAARPSNTSDQPAGSAPEDDVEDENR